MNENIIYNKSNIISNINYYDIFNFINEKLNFKKIGNYYFAICPFHIDKKPSFILNKNGIYYCFGCGSKGNIINFIMNYEKLSYIDSIKYIINNFKIYNLKYKYFNRYSLYYKINYIISNIYHNNLMNYVKNNNKIHYLENRNWSINTIKHFNIGISYKNQILNIFKNKKYFKEILYIGLVNKNLKYNDLFNFRIIFPIKNINGNIIGFGGRSLLKNKLKYINSKNSIIFRKNNVLFGLFEVNLHFNKNIPKILLVEGYSDVISLFNKKIFYSVSSLGTSITDFQIKLLFKYTNKILFCFDNDNAGNKAAFKTLINTIKYITDDKEVKFIFLPKNEDPDSFINKVTKYKFENFILKNSKNFYDLIFNYYFTKIKKFDIFNKIYFINKINKFIKLIPGNLMKLFVRKELIKKINKVFFLNRKNIYKNNNNKCYINQFKLLISLFIQNTYLNIDFNKYNELYKSKNFKIKFFISLYKFCKINKINSFKKNILFFKNKKYYNFILKMYKYNNLIKKDNIYLVFNDILKWLNNILFYKKIKKLLKIYNNINILKKNILKIKK
ncbi:DNA primase [Candidatus Nardonella dryophthoridicola]|uniref:DNA primase n=1 Tax=Candidatus Nardonella dryophthoridicola TaxID=1971485 RepID=UPI001AD871A8|nr:DNA primase [Candidatus Nardonella dryophthoridicola]QTJ62969.1 DNA primase [Candidatus Nardonella dryophthoridicola]